MAVSTTTDVKTTDLILRDAVEMFAYKGNFISTIMNYSSKLGDFSYSSRKTGPIITQAKPARFSTTIGTSGTKQDFSPQDVLEDTYSINVNQYAFDHIIQTTEVEALNLTDFGKQELDPMVASMVAKVEGAHLGQLTADIGNVVLNASGLDIDDAGTALSILNEMGAPQGKRFLNAPTRIHNSVVINVSNLFNPTAQISKQYLEGYMGRAQGFDWVVNELNAVHTNGTATSLGTLSATPSNGAAAIAVTGGTASGTITAGTTIEIVATNAINMLTYEDLGYKKQFAVAADVTLDGAGAGTITLSEKIYDDTNTLQNVSALPQSGAAVSFIGAASTAYRQGLAYAPEAFACAFAKLNEPKSTDYSRRTVDGVSMRMINDYDKDVDANAYRLDCLFGLAVARPEWAVKLWQPA
jgi:hypothetical protein